MQIPQSGRLGNELWYNLSKKLTQVRLNYHGISVEFSLTFVIFFSEGILDMVKILHPAEYCGVLLLIHAIGTGLLHKCLQMCAHANN